MDHLDEAERALGFAENQANSQAATRDASLAAAHAVLALIDIITGDREEEIQAARSYITDLEKLNDALELRVSELADQLDGCNDTVRRHEQAAAANTKPNNDLRKSYE